MAMLRHPAWPWPARSAQQVLRGKGGIADQQVGTVAIMLIGVKFVTGSNGSLG